MMISVEEVLKAFHAKGLPTAPLDNGKYGGLCPFSHLETHGAEQTIIYPPSRKFPNVGIKCFDPGCEGRITGDYLKALGLLNNGAVSDPEPQGIDGATLWAMDHPDPKWAVPELIPEGVTILAGRPKVRKSWFMLGIGIAVASGGMTLGSIRAIQGDVLYLALEDSQRRLTRRLRSISSEEAPPKGRLTFYTEWQRLHEGGVELIKKWLDKHSEARLVVIDTLAKVRPPNSKAGNIYTDDYIVGDLLTDISKQYGIAIVVVHHVRKLDADDPIDLISGSLGLTGSVDGYMVLRKEPGTADAFLYVNGRDIEDEGNYALEWQGPTCTWHMKDGEARIYKLSPERRRVIDLLVEHGPMSSKEVTESLNPGIEIKDSAESKLYRKTQFLLHKLRDDGYIHRRHYDKKWEVLNSTDTTNTTNIADIADIADIGHKPDLVSVMSVDVSGYSKITDIGRAATDKACGSDVSDVSGDSDFSQGKVEAGNTELARLYPVCFGCWHFDDGLCKKGRSVASVIQSGFCKIRAPIKEGLGS